MAGTRQEYSFSFITVVSRYCNVSQFYHSVVHNRCAIRLRTVAKRHIRSSSSMLLHLIFWFHVSSYRNFWNNERWKSCIKYFSIMKLFHLQNLFRNGANDMSECLTCETAFCKKKLRILYSSDHPILIKFRQLVVNIIIKELQLVFLTSTEIKSNGNMKELESQIKCEKLMFR